MKALTTWSRVGRLKSVTLITDSDRPRTVEEFQEALVLRERGETIDGRLYREAPTWTTMFINTGWPRFSHWGKQSWLREMLLDPSGIEELVKEIHDHFGGELWIDGSIYLKDHVMVGKGINLNPRGGKIKIILAQKSSKRKNH